MCFRRGLANDFTIRLQHTHGTRPKRDLAIFLSQINKTTNSHNDSLKYYGNEIALTAPKIVPNLVVKKYVFRDFQISFSCETAIRIHMYYAQRENFVIFCSKGCI